MSVSRDRYEALERKLEEQARTIEELRKLCGHAAAAMRGFTIPNTLTPLENDLIAAATGEPWKKESDHG